MKKFFTPSVLVHALAAVCASALGTHALLVGDAATAARELLSVLVSISVLYVTLPE
jgi:hypothetical protein